MKKLLTIAALSAVGFAVVTMTSCTAQTPKASLKTDLDSLAYAEGVNRTQGLDMYLATAGVDSTVMADFIKGLQEGAQVKKDDKKTAARMMGLQIGTMISQKWITDISKQYFGDDSTKTIDKANFLAGFIAATTNKELAIQKENAQMFVQMKGAEIHQKALEAQYAEKKAADLKFLEDNKKNEGVVVLPSGLQYKVITEGKGAKPTATDVVRVHYVGTTTNGTEFESSVKNGTPAEIEVNRVIAGWIEGLQLMPVGSKYMFWIPYNLAYGPEGSQGRIDPFSTLIFEIELLDIVKQ